MKREYRLVLMSVAFEREYPEAEASFGYGYEYALYEFVDGKPARLVGTDGGEPEDQTLTRGWSWVVEALNEAYTLGYDDGSEARA